MFDVKLIHHKAFKIWKQSRAVGIIIPAAKLIETKGRDARESFSPPYSLYHGKSLYVN